MTALPKEVIWFHRCPICAYPVMGTESQSDTANLVAHVSRNHTEGVTA